jgi:methylphosphotriester-DNA--protein-cysteine methyltransferase
MIRHSEIGDRDLRREIRRKKLCWGGNLKLKIYGNLSCASGKRMKKANRDFFSTWEEARQNGYRPCGNCMKDQYLKWKHGLI